jgi:hypothetical protein
MPVVNVPVTSNWRSVGVKPPKMSRLRFSSEISTTVSPSKSCMRSARSRPSRRGGSPDGGGSRLSAPAMICRSISVGATSVVSIATP